MRMVGISGRLLRLDIYEILIVRVSPPPLTSNALGHKVGM
jgi:hypothetical protein